VQPAILESFSTEENKSNGFLDRILLCCPEIKIEMYNSNEMEYDAIEYYDSWVRSFYRCINLDIRKNEDEEIISNIYKFDAEAKYEWEKIYNEISIMQNSDEENEYMKSMLPKQKSYIPRFALLIHLMNNFEAVSIPVLISRDTVLKSFELSKYFIKQAQKVKVSAKETKLIASIVAINKELSPKEIFEIMLKKGDRINYSKVAEMLSVTRATLYSWSKSV